MEEGWDKWGPTFMENFIGYTDNAKRCRIKNEKALRFRYFKKSNRLIAFSDEPIQIENNALGYKITYQLEDFELNFSERTAVFMGYSLYEEMGKDRKVWSKRRNAAYNGSMMHFMRSLFVDSLQENGFEARRLTKIPNLEKERVKKIYKIKRTSMFSGGTVRIGESMEGNHPTDSINYYQAVMRQPDFTDVYGKNILKADSLILQKDGDHQLLYFTGYLHITYKKELEEEAYLRSQMQSRKPSYQRSSLYLRDENPIWIERNGNYYNPKDIYSIGYWSWSDKLGDSVPLDFSPKE